MLSRDIEKIPWKTLGLTIIWDFLGCQGSLPTDELSE
jgi:hypothetical protein